MPKTKKKTAKKEEAEDELSELLQESLKKKKQTNASEEAEEDFEEGIDVPEFHQFFSQRDLDSGSPALERIAGSQTARPIFVGGIPQDSSTQVNGNGEKDEFTYISSANQVGEATYMGSTHTETETKGVDFANIGRGQVGGWNSMNVSEDRIAARENFGVSTQSFERADRVRQFDETKVGRDPSNQVKYEQYNPKKLPSGR